MSIGDCYPCLCGSSSTELLDCCNGDFMLPEAVQLTLDLDDTPFGGWGSCAECDNIDGMVYSVPYNPTDFPPISFPYDIWQYVSDENFPCFPEAANHHWAVKIGCATSDDIGEVVTIEAWMIMYNTNLGDYVTYKFRYNNGGVLADYLYCDEGGWNPSVPLTLDFYNYSGTLSRVQRCAPLSVEIVGL